MNIFGRLFYTVAMTVGSALISCIVVTLVAYPLARNHFKGSGKVFNFILISMFFPGIRGSGRAASVRSSPNPIQSVRRVLIMFLTLRGKGVAVLCRIRSHTIQLVGRDTTEPEIVGVEGECSIFETTFNTTFHRTVCRQRVHLI